MTDLATTIHNERTKLSATWLNGLAIALAAIGGFAPTVSYFAEQNQQTLPAITSLAVAVACLTMSIALHLVARTLLGRLKA
jgi:Na+/melibiose symporter-like transporter